MFAPDTKFEKAIRFTRFDLDHPLNSCSRTIQLEDESWPSAEHYVSSKLAGNTRLAKEVMKAETGEKAAQLIKPWYRMKVKGWRTKRRLFMTRALYIQVQMYDDVREYLLSTEDTLLADMSLYDHYWGVGRDLRGENMMGQIWMDIRQKLRDAASSPLPEATDTDVQEGA